MATAPSDVGLVERCWWLIKTKHLQSSSNDIKGIIFDPRVELIIHIDSN